MIKSIAAPTLDERIYRQLITIQHQQIPGVSSELDLSSYHIWSWRECISIHEDGSINIHKNWESYAYRVLIDYMGSSRGIWLNDNNVLIEISAYLDKMSLEKVAVMTAMFTKKQLSEWREFKIVEKMTSLYYPVSI
tara:strand:+ start:9 stop:416 length:408 start_codon:yes stop_codon:yes gene_type:complete